MRYPAIQRIAVAVLAIAFSVACPTAYPQQSGRSRPAKRADLDAVVSAWVQQSSRIKSLSATFTRTGKGLGTNLYRYEMKWKDSGQAVFETVQVGRKKQTESFEKVVWTGKEIWQYNPRKKEIMVWNEAEVLGYEAFRESVKGSWAGRLVGSRLDLIFSPLRSPKDIEPFPFLIGMKENVAKRRFRFELVENPDPKRIVVTATPLDRELRSSYDKVVITLDSERYLPIELVYHKGWNPRDAIRYTLVESKVDPALADAVFEPERPKGWKITSGSD